MMTKGSEVAGRQLLCKQEVGWKGEEKGHRHARLLKTDYLTLEVLRWGDCSVVKALAEQA